jgi:hypothetical protein
MAYTIVKSDGTVLTTIADGTINTSSTSLGLPGRNFAGYGQSLDTNFVHMTENFANATPPSNPLRGQLWYNTTANTLCVCPADGTSNANAWLALTSTSSGGATTFGEVVVTGDVDANNLTATNGIVGDTITVRLATVTANATISNAAITTGNIITLNTASITTGGNTTAGSMIGTWTVNGGLSGNTLIIRNGNLVAPNVVAGGYFYSNGAPFVTSTYTNANVFDYLTGSNSVSQFTGNIAPTKVTTNTLDGGGNVFGIWTLTANARWQATYADLAERFETDIEYPTGTVLEIGGEKEVTMAKEPLSENVFGVVSESAGYLMNAMAGPQETHPAIALVGRVKVRAIGRITKGSRLVSAGDGLSRQAEKSEITPMNVVGRALENKTTEAEGLVLAFVSARL